MPLEQKKNNLFMRLLSRYINWVAVLIVLALCLAGYLFLLQPKIDKFKANPELSLEHQQQVLNERLDKLEQLNSLIEDYKNLPSGHFVKINELLPTARENPIIFTHLSALATANDSVLMSVSASELGDRDLTTLLVKEGSPIPQNIKVVDIQAEFLGLEGTDGYAYYKQLVTALQNNLRLFDIQYINFTPETDMISVSARTYYLDLPHTQPTENQ